MIGVGFGKMEMGGLNLALKASGQKFGLQLLAVLMASRSGRGFNDLLREIPDISPRTLSLRLKELEAKRLISKNISMGPRLRIEYRITENGLLFEKAIAEMAVAGLKL